MLTVRDLHTHYGLSHVLQGVEFHVHDNELVALVGRNGVGKTTILKTIAGRTDARLHSPRRGADRRARAQPGLPPRRRLRAGGPAHLPGPHRRGEPQARAAAGAPRSAREKKAAVERAYQRFPRLLERRTQMGTTLSGGEQQMLAIARVLVGAPRLLLIDEPTEGLAPIIVDELFEIIAGLRHEGIAVILVEQNVVRTLDIADRAYAVERGRIILEAHPQRREERDRILEAIAV